MTGTPQGAATAGSGSAMTTPISSTPTPAASGAGGASGAKPATSGTTTPTPTTTSPSSGAAGKPATVTATLAGSGAAGGGGSSATTSTPTTSAGAGGSSSAAGGSSGAVPPAEGSTGSSCLDGIGDYDKDGPFKFDMKSAGSVRMWVPMVPAGCKVPLIHMANGTGASCSSYGPSMTRMASHGFLAICYDDPNTGAGDQGIMAFDAALKMFPDLADDTKYGSTGHSQGGQASFIVLQKAEAKYGLDKAKFAGLAMEPASGFGSQPSGGTWQSYYGKIKSPMFMFSGVNTDGLVSEGWVQQAFDAMDKGTEAYWWARDGATHIPVPNGEEQQISIPWFRWKLLGDQKACAAFKALKGMNGWMERKVQNSKECM
jgi:hypothetical protein